MKPESQKEKRENGADEMCEQKIANKRNRQMNKYFNYCLFYLIEKSDKSH